MGTGNETGNESDVSVAKGQSVSQSVGRVYYSQSVSNFSQEILSTYH